MTDDKDHSHRLMQKIAAQLRRETEAKPQEEKDNKDVRSQLDRMIDAKRRLHFRRGTDRQTR